MPAGGRAGLAGAGLEAVPAWPVRPSHTAGDARRLELSHSLRLRHRLRCRLEAVPAWPVRPSKAAYDGAATGAESLAQAEASLAMPAGGRAGLAGAAV